MSYKAHKILGWVLGLVILTAGCSPVKVAQTEAAPGFTLNRYQTFGFFEVDTASNSLNRYAPHVAAVKTEMVQALEQRGLRQQAQNPDLQVNLGVVMREEVQTRETNILSDPPNYIGQRRYSWRAREVEVGRYNEGTLTVDLVDREQNELVWQGAAEAVVPKDVTKLRNRIIKGVQQLVKSMP